MKRKSLIIPVMLTCVMLLNGCGAKSIDDIYSMASTEATLNSLLRTQKMLKRKENIY